MRRTGEAAEWPLNGRDRAELARLGEECRELTYPLGVIENANPQAVRRRRRAGAASVEDGGMSGDLLVAPTTFAEAAPRMYDNGYQPIPLSPARKIPIMAGWSALNRGGWDRAALATAIAGNAAAACGWAVGPHSLAVGLDILDAKTAARAADIVAGELGDKR